MHWKEDTEITIGDAMLQCSLESGRLVSIDTCDAATALMEEVLLLKGLINQTYYIGNIAFGKSAKASSYRNWESNQVIDAYVFSMDF